MTFTQWMEEFISKVPGGKSSLCKEDVQCCYFAFDDGCTPDFALQEFLPVLKERNK